jgi:hypothetical protein
MSDADPIRRALQTAWEDQIVAGFNDEDSDTRLHIEILADALIDVWKDYAAVGADAVAVSEMVLKMLGGMVITLGYCQRRGVL